MAQGIIPIVDLFAGPGGLGEGFSSEIFRERPFRIGVSVEKDPCARQTLSLRAFFRYFKHTGRSVPEEYYQYLSGIISRTELEELYPEEWKLAYNEAICAELGNEHSDHQPWIDKKITAAIKDHKDWVLIGGPPCQAYSLIGRSCILGYLKSERSGKTKADFENDDRHKLYQQYLRIIALYAPAVFVMENVKGILSSKLHGKKIFPRILKDLRDPSVAAKQYGWGKVKQNKYRIVSFVTGEEPSEGSEADFLIKAEKYGIPQARHRVILLGLREDIFDAIHGGITPLVEKNEITIKKVIGNLPKLRSGFSKGTDSIERWKKYFHDLKKAPWLKSIEKEVRDELIAALQELSGSNESQVYNRWGKFPLDILNGWYTDPELKGISHHETRTHMDSDLARYLFVAAYGKAKNRAPHLKNFPDELLPKHKNIRKDNPDQKFSDRFKVQVWDKPSSTITCHISKDGHYFIHPDPVQCRSLTVREAARIQTFPDNYFFEGGRTQQYHQVGNAVPPYLAKQLAEVVYDIFKKYNTRST
ncbi:MAG: DNA cytosine methyltransferase [Kiritimatiellales bacterium]